MDENPQQWWQHAGRAVLTERSQTLGSESSRWGLTNRRYYRRLYQLYYLRHRSYLFWLVDALRGNPHASRDALMHLESELGDGEIAQFRWWAWASQKSRGQVLFSPSDAPPHSHVVLPDLSKQRGLQQELLSP